MINHDSRRGVTKCIPLFEMNGQWSFFNTRTNNPVQEKKNTSREDWRFKPGKVKYTSFTFKPEFLNNHKWRRYPTMKLPISGLVFSKVSPLIHLRLFPLPRIVNVLSCTSTKETKLSFLFSESIPSMHSKARVVDFTINEQASTLKETAPFSKAI